MKTAMQLGNSITLRQTDALLIYRGEGKDVSYVTHHDIENGALGPAKPLTIDFAVELRRSLGRSLTLELFPPNVLARTPETIVWWTPAQHRPMFFTGSRLDDSGHELSGKSYPQPPLVWMADNFALYVRAIEKDERPTADTPLFVAPYWNVNEHGLVCTGSMTRPKDNSIDGINVWEAGFFASAFSHPNTPRLLKRRGSYLDAIYAICDAPTFPAEWLIPTKQTLADFLKGRNG